jgi:hypothetical protein
MTNDHLRLWLAAAFEAKSHRQMYAIALEIGKAGTLVSPGVRKAARNLARSLHGVIELPIADARVLAKADRRFAVLYELLKKAASGTPPSLAA